MSEAATNGLGENLRSAVGGISGVQIVDSPKGNYYTVKHGKRTLGYVNGKRKYRVGLPVKEGKREWIEVADDAQIQAVVDRLSSYIPAGEQEVNPDPKPSRKK